MPPVRDGPKFRPIAHKLITRKTKGWKKNKIGALSQINLQTPDLKNPSKLRWMPVKVVHDTEIIHLDRSLNSVVTVIPHDVGSLCIQNEDIFKFIIDPKRTNWLQELRNEARKLHPCSCSVGIKSWEAAAESFKSCTPRSLPCSKALT